MPKRTVAENKQLVEAPCGAQRYGRGGVFARCPLGCVTECKAGRLGAALAASQAGEQT